MYQVIPDTIVKIAKYWIPFINYHIKLSNLHNLTLDGFCVCAKPSNS